MYTSSSDSKSNGCWSMKQFPRGMHLPGSGLPFTFPFALKAWLLLLYGVVHWHRVVTCMVKILGIDLCFSAHTHKCKPDFWERKSYGKEIVYVFPSSSTNGIYIGLRKFPISNHSIHVTVLLPSNLNLWAGFMQTWQGVEVLKISKAV